MQLQAKAIAHLRLVRLLQRLARPLGQRDGVAARQGDPALGDAYKSAQSAVKSAEQALGAAERFLGSRKIGTTGRAVTRPPPGV